jgi:hypothetical protein
MSPGVILDLRQIANALSDPLRGETIMRFGVLGGLRANRTLPVVFRSESGYWRVADKQEAIR